jgi:hypothetical protein
MNKLLECKIRRLGLNVYYLIEKETNVGNSFLDTVNSYGWWKENMWSKTFESKKEAEEYIQKNINSIKFSCYRAGYQVEFVSVKPVPRVGKIIKADGTGREPFRDRFIQDKELTEKYISKTI